MNPMYKHLYAAMLLIVPLLINSCGTSTMITSSWRKPNATANRYRNVFIAAITSNISVKQKIEDGLQQLYSKKD
jgi:hypothetical protein